MIKIVHWIITLTLFGVLFTQSLLLPPLKGIEEPEAASVNLKEKPFYIERVASDGRAKEVHSAAVAEMVHGGLRAFWYGGTREGAKDVAIYTAILKPGDQQWSQSEKLLQRADTQLHLNRYIKKLGNPVSFLDHQGRMWLFYVSVGVGGWAGSSINYQVSDDDGYHWSESKKLITTPFLNVSSLVKGTPIFLKNGLIGLPMYHEFMGKFGEMLWLQDDGVIRDKQRITWGRDALQPIVLPGQDDQAVMLLRYAGEKPRRILQSRTADGGRHWSEAKKTELLNSDAAIGGITLPGGGLLIAMNNSEDKRDVLSLAYSSDLGKSWQVFFDVENAQDLQDGEKHRFSYPVLHLDRAGHYHLFYSWNRKEIRHVSFNHSWLMKQLPKH